MLGYLPKDTLSKSESAFHRTGLLLLSLSLRLSLDQYSCGIPLIWKLNFCCRESPKAKLSTG